MGNQCGLIGGGIYILIWLSSQGKYNGYKIHVDILTLEIKFANVDLIYWLVRSDNRGERDMVNKVDGGICISASCELT